MAPGGKAGYVAETPSRYGGISMEEEGWTEERVSGELVALGNDLMQVWPEDVAGEGGREEQQRAPLWISVWKTGLPKLTAAGFGFQNVHFP